jgi:hypothetical protein
VSVVWPDPAARLRDPGFGTPVPAAVRAHRQRVCYVIGDAALASRRGTQVRLHHQVNGNFNGLCPNERFWCQPVVLERSGEAFGSFGYSGYLLAPDLVLTCWHGWEHFQHSRQLAIFDYLARHGCDTPVQLQADSVVAIEPAPLFSPGAVDEAQRCAGDWVLLRLARPVHRASARVEIAAPRVGAAAYVLGHPLGLPVKLGQGGHVLSADAATFRVGLDTYTGSSGSPVFDADSHALIGIVIEGPPGAGDFMPQPRGHCYVYRSSEAASSGALCIAATCFAASIAVALATGKAS